MTIKPRHLYSATSVEVDALDGAISLTFRTDQAIDLTIALPADHAKRMRDQISFYLAQPTQETERP